MTDSWHYRIGRIDSWARDKITTRGGRPRTHRPVGDAEAKRAHALEALAARPRGWALDAVYSVAVYYCRESGHRRDVDRVLSLVLDALTGVAWTDDNDTRVLAVRCERLASDYVIEDDCDPVHVTDGETLVVVRRVASPARRRR